MFISYIATEEEDKKIEKALANYHISNWFNPEDDYYVMETQDDKVITIMALFGIEIYITESVYE